MANGYTCPFCNQVMAISSDTHRVRYPSFDSNEGYYISQNRHRFDDSTLLIDFFKCPSCGRYSILTTGYGEKVKTQTTNFIPNSVAKQFPDYIPESIRSDYEEACAIVSLSPKASATLSRRCLQGMIRDFWGISKRRLVDEISDLQDKVPPQQWRVIDGLRKIGNIGAHPETDVNTILDIEPADARKLISVIELLLQQWYVQRHEQEQLYADILAIDEDLQSQR